MQTIGLIVNHDKPRARPVLATLGAEARKLGLHIVADAPSVQAAGLGTVCPVPRMVRSVEGILVLGGDGTMLKAAREIGARDCPLMGINLGSLGYLTRLEETQLPEALDSLRHDTFETDSRTRLGCRVWHRGRALKAADALNDVVVARGASGRVVELDLHIDGLPVTAYICDGLMVSTPTGSTAYALSAGGPIMLPGTAAILVSVICPHTLTSRPLVVPHAARISIAVRRAEAPLIVSIDGQEDHLLETGDRIEVFRSAHDVRFALLPGHNAYAVLSRKLGWGGSLPMTVGRPSETQTAVVS